MSRRGSELPERRTLASEHDQIMITVIACFVILLVFLVAAAFG